MKTATSIPKLVIPKPSFVGPMLDEHGEFCIEWQDGDATYVLIIDDEGAIDYTKFIGKKCVETKTWNSDTPE